MQRKGAAGERFSSAPRSCPIPQYAADPRLSWSLFNQSHSASVLFLSVAATRAVTGSWGSGRVCTGTHGECKGGQGSRRAISLITLRV